MDIKICSVCGHKNPKNKMYCEKCGSILYSELIYNTRIILQ